MTENYLHFDSNDFAKAMTVQDSLLAPDTPKAGEKEAAANTADKQEQLSKVIPFPVKSKAKKALKQA
jgi:hypothetical protein